MKIQVYGDIVFLINFCMDYILLAFMCKIMVCKSSRLRRTLAAILGGVCSIVAFYIPAWLGVPMQIVLAAAMCTITAPCRKVRDFLARLAVLCGSALIFGGGTLAVLCIVGADVLMKNGAFYIDISIGILVLSSFVCSTVLWLLEQILRRTRANCRKSVDICFMGKSVTLRGYVDTGNTLTCGGTPVILMSWEAIQPLMPDGTDERNFYTKCPPGKIRAVPYKHVGGDGIVWCIVPDYVHICGKPQNALAGICPHTLSSEYDALLYASM